MAVDPLLFGADIVLFLAMTFLAIRCGEKHGFTEGVPLLFVFCGFALFLGFTFLAWASGS